MEQELELAINAFLNNAECSQVYHGQTITEQGQTHFALNGVPQNPGKSVSWVWIEWRKKRPPGWNGHQPIDMEPAHHFREVNGSLTNRKSSP